VCEREVVLETDRLLLRQWRVEDVEVQRQLWLERDPRVPDHRRIGPDGHPTVGDLQDRLRDRPESRHLGLLVVERKRSVDMIGYCGLVDSSAGHEQEPELAFELLRETWGQGYATEASWAVLQWAESTGLERVWATVSDWNAASRRVLAKLGFIETDHVERGPGHGDVLLAVRES